MGEALPPASCHKTRPAAWTTHYKLGDLAFPSGFFVSMKAAMNRGGRCNSKVRLKQNTTAEVGPHKPCSWNPVRPFVRSGLCGQNGTRMLRSAQGFLQHQHFPPPHASIHCKIIFIFIFNFYLYSGLKLSFRAFWCSLPHTVLQTLSIQPCLQSLYCCNPDLFSF